MASSSAADLMVMPPVYCDGEFEAVFYFTFAIHAVRLAADFSYSKT